jgi:hypothetical protein
MKEKDGKVTLLYLIGIPFTLSESRVLNETNICEIIFLTQKQHH